MQDLARLLCKDFDQFKSNTSYRLDANLRKVHYIHKKLNHIELSANGLVIIGFLDNDILSAYKLFLKKNEGKHMSFELEVRETEKKVHLKNTTQRRCIIKKAKIFNNRSYQKC